MFIIRWVLGRFILFFDFIFSPTRPNHSDALQAKLDEQTRNLQLYQFAACPFCVKVRRDIRRKGLNIKLVDAKQADNRQELLNNGGKVQVPCLRIEKDSKVDWLYESNDIINYLEELLIEAK